VRLAVFDASIKLTGSQDARQIKLRQFSSTAFDTVTTLRRNLANKGRKGGVPKGVSSRMFDDCVEIFRGYGAVDDV